MGERSLGIEITSSQIKLVEMDSSTSPPRIFSFSSIPLLSSQIENISEQMRAALSHINPKTKKARMAISDPYFHHILSLPPMPEKELRVVAERELRGTMTIPLREMVFGYRVMGEEEEQKKKIVLAIGASSNSVSKQALFLKDIGLTPELITTVPVALFNSLRLTKDVDQYITAHIHLEESKGHILFVRKGRWAFYREFSRSPNTKEEILSEVQRSFLYFRQQFRGEDIKKVFLSGSETEGFEKELGETLGMDVERLLPTLDLSPLNGRVKEFSQMLHEFTIPIGLAGKRVRDTVNLLSTQVIQPSHRATLKSVAATLRACTPEWSVSARRRGRPIWDPQKVAFAGIVLSAFIIGLSYLWLSNAVSTSNRMLQEKREALKRFEPYIAAQKESQLYLKNLAFFRDFNYNLLWAETLRELSLLVPPEAALRSLTFKRESDKIKIAINGEVIAQKASLGQEIFSRFYSKMASSSFFVKVEIDPNSVKVSHHKGDEKEDLVKMEFEVKGELRHIDIEYENP